jgi:arginyl-tRNA synthetase
MQYAHARCCSLLRLADQEGLIELTNLDFSQPTWHWQQPEPIPYLDGTRLRLGQPSEQKLIAQLLRVIEAQLDEQPLDTAKLAYHLSQAFLEFERYCRIWGEVKQDHLALAQARLGLIALTQLLLKKLLEKLCIPSPAGL